MRTFILLFFGTAFSFAPINGLSQNTKITLEGDQLLSVDQVFEIIEEQTPYHFIYRSGMFKETPKVKVKGGQVPIKKLLNTSFATTDFDFKVRNDNIIITKKPMAQQEGTITGVVTGENNVPLPGVNVTVKGTSHGTSTDFDGKYEIEAEQGQTLVFSSVGFKNQEITIGEDDTIDVTMKEGTALDEVVVVGYGTQKRKDVTGAISTVNSDEIEKVPNGNPNALLRGRASGVSVVASSGQPGSSPTIQIRGMTSIGDNSPLYIVDGVQVDNINWLNPSDIESISVLKDGSSAAIYGVSAAAGVVLVKTKEGKKGKVRFSYKGTYGIANTAKKLNLLNAEQYARMINEKLQNDGKDSRFDDPSKFGKGTDWQDQIFHTGIRQSHEFSVRGGSEKSTFYGSFGYFNEEGIVQPDISYQKKLTARLNSSHKLFHDYLTIGEKVSYSHTHSEGVDTNNEFGGPLSSAINLDPITPVIQDYIDNAMYPNDYSNPYIVRDPNGNPYGISHWVNQEMANPRASKRVARGNYNWDDNFIANGYAQVDLEGFTFKSSINAKLSYWGNRNFTPLYYYSPSGSNTSKNSLNRGKNKRFDWSIENTLKYDKDFGKHSINVLIGQGYYEYNIGSGNSVTYQDLPVDNFEDASFNFGIPNDDINADAGDNIVTHKASYFGRIIYNYDDRYIFTGTIRRDGSSRFGSDSHWGNFPSFSVGWNVSNEEFWPENAFVNNLKLKGGYGELGNDAIGNFQFASFMESGSNYTNGNNEVVTGYRPNTLPNPKLHWERTKQTDIGIDMMAFTDFNVEVSWYNKRTDEMLRPRRLPGYVGVVGDPQSNIGIMTNRGVEVNLGYNKDWDDFGISVNGNFSTLRNRLNKLEEGRDFIGGASIQSIGELTRIEVGKPYGYFRGFETNGIFQNQDEIDSYVNEEGDKIQPDAQPGDFKWVDTNGDGKINNDDKTDLGNSLPTYTYGLNIDLTYKNFDLNVFAQGQGGNKIFNGLRRVDISDANYESTILGRWHGEGTSNSIPRLSDTDANGDFGRMSDYYLEDGSYLRLKQIQLGYTLPKTLTQKIWVDQVRFFITAENVATITKYKGYDPEIAAGNSLGIDRGYYPQARTFLIGANVKF